MTAQKIKRYRLGVSRKFPKGHPRAGESTNFVEKIFTSFDRIILCSHCGFIRLCRGHSHCVQASLNYDQKLHTIRSNYPLWEKRMKEVHVGRAVIELFYWEGKQRHKGSKQIVFATLDKDSGCGLQEIIFIGKISCVVGGYKETKDDLVGNIIHAKEIAKNDGLSIDDFKAWFKSYDLSKPMAIIHFTKFRY